MGRGGQQGHGEQLAKLAASQHGEVFLDLDEEIKYEEYLETHLGNILENQAPSDEQKAAIFSRVSANVVKNAVETSLGLGAMDQKAMDRTQAMVKNALMFIAQSKSLEALTTMIGHDYKTYEHAAKVLWFTTAFLKENPAIMEQIQPDYRAFDAYQRMEALRQCGVGALLHDIGKAFVSPEILNKDGPLTAIEWEVMKRHPLNGLAMLLESTFPSSSRKPCCIITKIFMGAVIPWAWKGCASALWRGS